MVNSKWLNGKLRNPRSGFTLVELLVVIAIIGILAAVVMIAINPAEMARKGRDATRLSDIENVRKAIDIEVAQGAAVPNTGGVTRNSFNNPAPPAGRVCSGTGWVNMNLCTYLAALPVDPTNNATYQYQFRADGTNYELQVQLESASNNSKEQNDGGNNAAWYEVGTVLTLIP